jgi:hypothetical protein
MMHIALRDFWLSLWFFVSVILIVDAFVSISQRRRLVIIISSGIA